jgi:arylsulfatase A-like enzyme
MVATALAMGMWSATAPAAAQQADPAAALGSGARPNIVYIVADDLGWKDVGFHGSDIRTPNIDALASSGLTFTRAYCQQAVCSPSRTSLLTGLRPDTTRVYDLDTHFRRYRPDAVTLPEHFKKRGYTSAAFSKIFHKPTLDDQQSWSLPSWIPGAEQWNSSESRESAAQRWNDLQANGWMSSGRSSYEPSKAAPAAEGQRGWGMTPCTSMRLISLSVAERAMMP